ncbi:hypothetical protein V8C42DRAFT_338579 [Trichoderma barbatum]
MQWIEAKAIDETAMLNGGQYLIDYTPVCDFETSLYRVRPGKSQFATDSIVSLHSVYSSICTVQSKSLAGGLLDVGYRVCKSAS